MPDLVTDARVNMRADSDTPVLVLDGTPFPYHIDKAHGVKVEAHDASVHLVIVAILVDRSVTITDCSAP